MALCFIFCVCLFNGEDPGKGQKRHLMKARSVPSMTIFYCFKCLTPAFPLGKKYLYKIFIYLFALVTKIWRTNEGNEESETFLTSIKMIHSFVAVADLIRDVSELYPSSAVCRGRCDVYIAAAEISMEEDLFHFSVYSNSDFPEKKFSIHFSLKFYFGLCKQTRIFFWSKQASELMEEISA